MVGVCGYFPVPDPWVRIHGYLGSQALGYADALGGRAPDIGCFGCQTLGYYPRVAPVAKGCCNVLNSKISCKSFLFFSFLVVCFSAELMKDLESGTPPGVEITNEPDSDHEQPKSPVTRKASKSKKA